MAWVRIHDGAMQNLKVTTLTDSAFRLWIRGLCYCQSALTDGLIPDQALRDMGAKRKDVDTLASVRVEGRGPLWEKVTGFGYKVHDYLDWNDCRETVSGRQQKAKDRKDAWELKRACDRADDALPGTLLERVPDVVQNAVPIQIAAISQPNQTKPNQKEEKYKIGFVAPVRTDTRAGDFLDRYPAIYARVRNGARYLVRPGRDYHYACQIVEGWDDDKRLDLMVELFLRMSAREANNIPGTPGQFLNMAPECDSRLREAGR